MEKPLAGRIFYKQANTKVKTMCKHILSNVHTQLKQRRETKALILNSEIDLDCHYVADIQLFAQYFWP